MSYAITVFVALSTVILAAALLAWAGRVADRWGRSRRRGAADHHFGV